MEEIKLVLALLLVAVVSSALAHRFRWSEPIVMVLVGMLLSLMPGFHRVHLAPNLMFLVFLPPMLYLNAWRTSWRDLKDNAKAMFLMAVGLVIVTTAAVSVMAHYLIPTLTLAGAMVLGAVVSPPDAIAATAVTEKLSVPRRIVTLLEGESLLNDATALVLFSFAVTASITGTFSLDQTLMRFLTVSVGGIALGLSVGMFMSFIRHRINDTPVEIALSLLSPYAAYLPAEMLHLSGVLSVVTAGLYMGWRSPTMMTSYTRLEAQAVWRMLMFLLNGVVFLLTGLQLPVVLEALQAYPLAMLVAYSVSLIATVIVVRIIYVFFWTYVPPSLGFSITGKRSDPNPPWQNVFIVAWSGMRGAISIAAALSLPIVMASGEGFPNRNLIIFLTFAVILGTLVFQGLTLPWIIRWLNVEDDNCYQCDELEARIRAVEGAMSKLDGLLQDEDAIENAQHLDQIRNHYQSRLDHYHQIPEEGSASISDFNRLHQLHLRVLEIERQELLALRNRGEIKEDVLANIQRDLDIQELQLRQRLMISSMATA